MPIHCKVALIRREAKLGMSGTGDTEKPLLLQSLLNYLHEVELCKKGGSRLTSISCFLFPTWSLVANICISRNFHSSLFRQEKKLSQILLPCGLKGEAFPCWCFVNIAVHFLCLLRSSSKSAHLLLDLLDCSI